MSDPRWSIDAVRPLVSHENASGRHLIVTFTCPVSKKHVQARYTVPQNFNVGAQVANRVQQSAWYEVRRQAQSLVRGVLGGGAMGRIAGSALDGAIGYNRGYSTTQQVATMSASQREQALVEAFRSVSTQFAWAGNRWVAGSAAKQLLSPLDRQLADAPLTSAYDRSIAARMLVEVATAHGGVSSDEASHLEEMVGPEQGSLQALTSRPPITRAELAETTKGPVRVSLLTLAWTLALVDERFDPAEEKKLAAFADGLQLNAADRGKARDLARGWLMDQAFERAFGWGGHDAHARTEAHALGQRIGMTTDEVETAEAKYQKRRAG